MGLKLGALAAGVGAGYMAADKWKSKKKADNVATPSAYETKKSVESGFAGHTLYSEPERDAGPGDAGENMYADGGMVGCADKRWMKKKPR
jgi:hypothetical protein